MLIQDNEDEDKRTLYFDGKFKGINDIGNGESLFEKESNKETLFFSNLLSQLREQQFNIKEKKNFGTKIDKLGLFDKADIKIDCNGKKYIFENMLAVNKFKMENLPLSAISELINEGIMDLIYIHLVSLKNLDKLMYLNTN